MENQEAREAAKLALKDAEGARQLALRGSAAPFWYYPALGLVVAGVAVAFVLGPSLVRIGAGLLAVILGRLLFGAYSQSQGLAVGGLRSGKATIWSVGWIVAVMLLVAGTWALDVAVNAIWVVVLGAVLVFGITILYGIVFQSARRRWRGPLQP